MTTRREFLQSGGTLLLYFNLAPNFTSVAALAQPSLPQWLGSNPDLDTWLQVTADGMIRLSTGRCELGQGVQTALAQIAAEELDVPWGRIRVATVDTDSSPDEAYTSGSRSIEQGGEAVRYAAAEVRAILVGLAAEELGVGEADIEVRDGAFYVNGSDSGKDYWSVVREKSLVRKATGAAAPKPRADYRVVGQSVQRNDIPPKAYGEAIFIQDLRFEGMLHARVVRTDDPGAKLTLSQRMEARAGNLPGVVKIVRNGSFLAVVAEREEQAVNAARELAGLCAWERSAVRPAVDGMDAYLRAAAAGDSVVGKRGQPGAAAVARSVSRDYSRAFQAHASMSPSAALACYQGGRLTVWTHSQGVYPLRRALAAITGLAEEQVRCIHAQASGCYGHNGADDAAADAALIAMALEGRTIRLQWMRADEFLGEPYGSAMSIRITAGFDEAGAIVDWSHDVWSGTHSTRPGSAAGAGDFFAAQQIARPLPVPESHGIPPPRGGGDRNAVPLYNFANHRVTKHLVKEMPLRVSALRALGAYANVFAIESFMEETAVEQGADPIDFRIRYLDDGRAIAVLEKLRGMMAAAGMQGVSAPSGVGIGFARYKNNGCYCAVAMRLTADPASGDIRLERAVCATDAGLAVNPDGVVNQIEGGLVQACSWTLKERIRFDSGDVHSRDWASYPILTFGEVPQVEVALIAPPDAPPLGAGEASQGPAAAAIANAVSRATGRWVRNLPLRAQA